MEGESGRSAPAVLMAKHILARFARRRETHRSVCDGQDLRRALLAGYAWLEQHRDAINALNVFPVPDGDTGTNMTLTMAAATQEIASSTETSAAIIAEQVARGALMGARGNSGVILSQILRGLSHGLEAKSTFTASELAAALQEAAHVAYRAVIKPVEGTILTVVREAADAAQQSATRGSNITTMLGETVRAAHAAVDQTPDLLPALKQAGVVDAGGTGLTIILEGVWRYLRGEHTEASSDEQRSARQAYRYGHVSIQEDFGYEVIFMLSGEHLDVDQIRDRITAMGGVSTIIAGDTTLLKVHTHTPSPGQILDYGVSLGSLQDIHIENMQQQSLRYAAASAREHGTRDGANGGHAAAGAPGTAPLAPPPAPTGTHTATQIGTVAVAAGDGWVKLYHSLGATVIVPGGQTMNPSTQQLLEAVNNCPSEQVILLPNNGNVILSARQVPGLAHKAVHVVPSESLPQGVSALLAFNFTADFAANSQAMEAAIRRVRTVEVTHAIRAVQLDGVTVREGDIIGLLDGRLVAAGDSFAQVLHDSLSRIPLGAVEIFTLYHGAGVTADEASTMARQIKEWFPHQDIESVAGGQAYYAYIVSAE